MRRNTMDSRQFLLGKGVHKTRVLITEKHLRFMIWQQSGKNSNNHPPPPNCRQPTSMGWDVQGLEAQLLREVVAQERGELEEAKERLLLSLAADTRQLQDLQDRILKLLKVTTPKPASTTAQSSRLCVHACACAA